MGLAKDNIFIISWNSFAPQPFIALTQNKNKKQPNKTPTVHFPKCMAPVLRLRETSEKKKKKEVPTEGCSTVQRSWRQLPLCST